MDYRQLGASGLRVSALTLGTMTFGGRDNFASVGSTDVDGARRQLDLCLDHGINFVDTANVYSGGLSEEILGKAIEGRRDRLLLATKARMPMGDGPNDAGLSRHHLIAECEASLRRLGTDHIDLYQVHEWDGQTPLEETMEALDTLVRSGKVRYVGASNYSGWQLMKALGVADRPGYQRFATPADLLLAAGPRRRVRARPDRRRPGRRHPRLEPARGRPAVRQVPARPAGPGGLTPAQRLERAAGARPRAALRRVDALVEIAEGHGVSAAQVALAWLLRRPGITSLIVGARTDEQLADNLAAAELRAFRRRARPARGAEPPAAHYPLWHQVKTAADRLGPAVPPCSAPRLTSRHAGERAVGCIGALPA